MPELKTLLKRISNTGPMMDIARKILVTFSIFAKFAILKAVLFKSFLLKLRKELVSKVLLTSHHSLTKKIFFWRLVKGLNFGFSQTYQITLRFVVISQKDFPHLQVQNCSDNLKIKSQSFAFHNLVPRNETVKMSLKHFLFWCYLKFRKMDLMNSSKCWFVQRLIAVFVQ